MVIEPLKEIDNLSAEVRYITPVKNYHPTDINSFNRTHSGSIWVVIIA